MVHALHSGDLSMDAMEHVGYFPNLVRTGRGVLESLRVQVRHVETCCDGS